MLSAYAGTDAAGKWSDDWAGAWVYTGAGRPLPDGHELAAPGKGTDQHVLATLLRLNLERAGK